MRGFTREYIITFDASFIPGRVEYEDEELSLKTTLDISRKNDIEDLMFLVFTKLKQSRFPIAKLKGLMLIE